MFPLYLEAATAGGETGYRVNFDESCIARLGDRLGVRWQPDGAAGDDAFGPLQLLYYSYALFFSPTYRRRYAEQLRSGFPRVLLPRRPELFRELALWGGRLAERHLLRDANSALPGSERVSQGRGSHRAETAASWFVHGVPLVASGYPTYRTERISLARDVWLEPVPRGSLGLSRRRPPGVQEVAQGPPRPDARRLRSGDLHQHRLRHQRHDPHDERDRLSGPIGRWLARCICAISSTVRFLCFHRPRAGGATTESYGCRPRHLSLKLRVAEFPRIRGHGRGRSRGRHARILGNSATFGRNAQLQRHLSLPTDPVSVEAMIEGYAPTQLSMQSQLPPTQGRWGARRPGPGAPAANRCSTGPGPVEAGTVTVELGPGGQAHFLQDGHPWPSLSLCLKRSPASSKKPGF